MLTSFTAKRLMNAYEMSSSNYHNCLSPHRKELRKLATLRPGSKKKLVVPRNYNSRQLEFIVFTILKDTPEGYEWNKRTLVKIEEK